MSAIRILVLVSLAFSLSAHPFGGKTRDWQTGTVLDPQHSPYFTASTNDAPYGGKADVPLKKVYQSYLLEGATSAWFVREGLSWEWRKPANLKPGGPVKFAVVGQKMFVLDSDGREHRMQITRQVPKH